MKFLNHMFNKHHLIAVCLAIVILITSVKVFAAGCSSGRYASGNTPEQNESPADTNCKANIPIIIPTNWLVTGNSGLADATNFIGTTNNIPFNIKVNNQKAGRIDATLFNTFLGYLAGDANTAGNFNTAIGYKALFSNTTGYMNTAIGAGTLLFNTTGHYNTAIGLDPMVNNTTGSNNVAIGFDTLSNNTIGNSNAAFGMDALLNNDTGNSNIAVGEASLESNLTGNNNTALGFEAGSYSTGNGNLFLGNQAGKTFGTGSNELWIDNGNNAIPLIFGNFMNRFVGIGTKSPTSPLQVVGLPAYANNAAALAGGLTVGAFYRTGGDPDLVSVVH